MQLHDAVKKPTRAYTHTHKHAWQFSHWLPNTETYYIALIPPLQLIMACQCDIRWQSFVHHFLSLPEECIKWVTDSLTLRPLVRIDCEDLWGARGSRSNDIPQATALLSWSIVRLCFGLSLGSQLSLLLLEKTDDLWAPKQRLENNKHMQATMHTHQ